MLSTLLACLNSCVEMSLAAERHCLCFFPLACPRLTPAVLADLQSSCLLSTTAAHKSITETIACGILPLRTAANLPASSSSAAVANLGRSTLQPVEAAQDGDIKLVGYESSKATLVGLRCTGSGDAGLHSQGRESQSPLENFSPLRGMSSPSTVRSNQTSRIDLFHTPNNELTRGRLES